MQFIDNPFNFFYYYCLMPSVQFFSYSPWMLGFVTFDFLLYISYKTTFFKNNYCLVISKWILIIFAPEETEIFKDYLFIIA